MRNLLLATLLVAVSSTAVPASNNRSKCLNNLSQLGWAMEAYRERHGSLPADICDEQGHALLSWRVRLLPYLEEDHLYKQFRLNEPWDSPHNRKFLESLPPLYSCPSSEATDGRTYYVKLLGQIKVLLVEVDEDHACPWTKPSDQNYDPRSPVAGLARRHFADSLNRNRPGGLVLFSDGKIRFVPVDIGQDLLRDFFAAGEEGLVSQDLSWYRAMFTWPIGIIIWPWLLLSLSGAVGVSWIVPRLLRRLPVSPGEMLWLIAGAGQLAHFLVVMACYRYERLPVFKPDPCFPCWFLPSLAATLTGVIPVMWYRSSRVWLTFFMANFLLLVVVSLDARAPHQDRSADESFITAASPTLLAILAAMMIKLSFMEPSAWRGRCLAHWTGIVLCLLPFVFFAICILFGLVYPRELFVRVRY